jgi:hypothetical protein
MEPAFFGNPGGAKFEREAASSASHSADGAAVTVLRFGSR